MYYQDEIGFSVHSWSEPNISTWFADHYGFGDLYIGIIDVVKFYSIPRCTCIIFLVHFLIHGAYNKFVCNRLVLTMMFYLESLRIKDC